MIEAGKVYRTPGSPRLLIAQEEAPTPDGSEQAYWFIDVESRTNRAFRGSAVTEVSNLPKTKAGLTARAIIARMREAT